MQLISFQTIETLTIISLILLSIPILKAMLGAPFVPTPRETMQKMLDKAHIKPGQIVYDLGCGDGRFIRVAAREYQAKAIGIELNPLLYLYAKLRSWKKPNEIILCKDFTKVDLSNADIIVSYLIPQTMAKIEDKLNTELRKGVKIISHGFRFKKWEPIEILQPSKKEYGRIYIFEKK